MELKSTMGTESTKLSVPAEETEAPENARQGDEGVGVFRGLIWTFVFYLVLAGFGLLAWFVWKHWPAH